MASEKAREREVYRYYQTWLESSLGFKQSQLLSLSDRFHSDGSLLKQSRDKALVSFAQLGALRLNVKRGLITLISSTQTYILAEATQTLSLVSDTQHAPNDELWFGNASMPRSQGISENALNPAAYVARAANGSDYAAAALVISDITQDERFRHRGYAGDGGIRFYVGVPIMAATGYAIGVYTVHDDKPRTGLSAEELHFLEDMASIVSDHLDKIRSEVARYRGEKMVLGLGSFIEGRSTTVGHGDAADTNPRAGRALDSRSNSQMSDGEGAVPQFKGMDITSANLDTLRGEWTEAETDTIMGPTDRSAQSPQEIRSSFLTPGYIDAHKPQPTGWEANTNATTASTDPTFAPGSDADDAPSLPLELRQVFARAANIMRECTSADGVVFYEALSTNDGKGFSTSHPRPALKTQPSDSSTTGGGSSDDSTDRREDSGSHHSSDSGGGAPDSFAAAHFRNSRRKNCARLGYSLDVSARSTATESTLSTLSITEHNLRRFIRRYPHGKVFYYTEEGDVSTSDGEIRRTTREPKSPIHDRSHTHKLSSKILAGELLKVVPGARNVIFLPLWDFNLEKWAAATFVWSRRPGQLLNAQDDLSYLKAFCNSIMSAVSRLDAVAADKAKTSFIANISHELRSPLHGILGSIEFLNDTATDAFQSSMMTSIETCGRTLLDTVNHVLDYAKINQLSRSIERRPSKKGKSPGSEATGDGHKFSTNSLEADFDLATVVEEVVEAVYAGQTFRPKGPVNHDEVARSPMAEATPLTRDVTGRKRNLRGSNKFLGGVRLVLDIERIPNYMVHGQPGAIRRLVMNVLGNALKYTDRGSIRVSLRSTKPRSSPTSSLSFCLTVADSGRGMSTDFVRNHAFTAFTQEDSFSTGTGLGLSIVRQIVNSLNGKIDLQSQKGVGTHIKIWLTLPAPCQPTFHSPANVLPLVMEETPGLKLCILDSTLVPWRSEPATNKIRNVVEKSLTTLATEWFGMEILTSPSLEAVSADFLAYAEPPPMEYLLHHHGQHAKDQEVPLILIASNAFESASLRANGLNQLTELGRVIEIISQPCGPQKLAKALDRCLRRLEKLVSDPRAQASSGPVSLQIADNPGVPESQTEVHHTPIPVEESSSSDPATPRPPLHGVKSITKASEEELPSITTPNGTRPRPILPPRTGTFSSSSFNDSDDDDTKLPVLLVDDNEINLKLLVTFMKKARYPHQSSMDGQQALNAYKEANDSDRPFRHILMDVSMPVMDGITATREIRAYEKTNKIHPCVIIALTGLATEGTQNDAFHAGVDYFLPKPVRFRNLLALLRG